MGATYIEERKDIEEVRELVEQNTCLRRYLSHHLRNALMQIDLGLMHMSFREIECGRDHMLRDLEEVGL